MKGQNNCPFTCHYDNMRTKIAVKLENYPNDVKIKEKEAFNNYILDPVHDHPERNLLVD